MRRATTFSMLAAERLPGKVRGGALRLLGACIAIWVLGMFSPEITPHTASIILIVGWSFIAAIVLVIAFGTHRVVERLDVPLLGAGVARVSGAHAGAAQGRASSCSRSAFFLFWTLIYIGVWRSHPAGAFKGLPQTPTFSDFFYYSVSTGFISPPGDITAVQQGRPHGDDDRAAHGHGGAGGLHRLVHRLRPAAARPRWPRARSRPATDPPSA